MHVSMKKGDCLYIPAFYWYQIRTESIPTPKPDASAEERQEFEDQVKIPSISVDFWYEVSSIWMKQVIFGLEKQILI